MIILVCLWCTLGLVGSFLLWTDEVLFAAHLYKRPAIWCPTPRAIFFILVGSIFGIATLIAGLIIWLVETGSAFKGSWWDRPICKPKSNPNAPTPR